MGYSILLGGVLILESYRWFQCSTTASAADTECEVTVGEGIFKILSAHLNSGSSWANQAGINYEKTKADGSVEEHILIDGYVKLHVGLSLPCPVIVEGPGRIYGSVVKEDASTSRFTVQFVKLDQMRMVHEW